MCSRGNWMSITAPMHWTILPSLVWVVLMVPFPVECSNGGGAADDFRKLLRDRGLPCLVVDEREVVDDARGVVAGGLHRHHARRLLARDVLRHGLVDDLLHVTREQLLEDDARVRLVEIVPVRALRGAVVAQAVGR